MKPLLQFKEEIQVENETTCKGIFWRASVSSFYSSHNSIEVRKSLRLLKRKSCSGCDQCYWLYEYLCEDIYGVSPLEDYLGDLKHGAVYTYHVSTSQGFEDLYPEIDNIDFVEVK